MLASPLSIQTSGARGLQHRLTSRGSSRRSGARPCARRALVGCWAHARPFQAGGGSDPRPELASHALAATAEASTAQQAPALQEPQTVWQQLRQLEALCAKLRGAAAYTDKVELLVAHPCVAEFFRRTPQGAQLAEQLAALSAKEVYVLLCLPAMGQEHVLSLLPPGPELPNALAQLGGALARVEDFYDSIGGLLGYQRQCVELICKAQQQAQAAQQGGDGDGSCACGEQPAGGRCELLVPSGLNLADPAQAGAAGAASLAGLAALPSTAEIYPLGGAGDRLGLRCEATGECLPTAVLQYCGRSLLECLVRDLQAREYLHWRVHGRQATTPVAIMTSAAKGNHWRVKQAFEAAGWFGRGRHSFKLFQQPLVPMVSGDDGRWLLSAPLQPLMKPGGHGVIWKLMLDSGVFDWLRAQGRSAAIVRQISNPMAGVDNTLLALAGSGHSSGAAFGFASCERAVGAAEGINVLMRQTVPGAHGEPAHYEHRLTNVEYTEFERLGFADQAVGNGSTLSKFPANTNVLFIGLQAVERLVRESVAQGTTDAVLPGMILNLKKQVSFHDAWLGFERSVAAGRLECTMQNLADCLVTPSEEPLEGSAAAQQLDSFVVYNQRRKVTSSAKRKLKPGSTKLSQTPDGSFFDLQRNARELLQRCGFDAPEVGSVEAYLASGPALIFLFHPALGPLWDVVAQKLRGGSLAPRSELVLEVAEAQVEGLHLQGSLLVHADSVLGHMEASPHHTPFAPAPGTLRRRVHNGVEHSATEGGAFCGVMLPPNPAAAAAAQQQLQQRGGGGAFSAHPGAGEPRLVYSDRCGRLRLRDVRVVNRGVDWEAPDNVYWRHKVQRHESLRIVLHGRSEFEAEGVTLSGDLLFEVPDGQCMRVTAGPDGQPRVQLRPLGALPSWRWEYCVQPPATRTAGASCHAGVGCSGVVLRLVEESGLALAAEAAAAAVVLAAGRRRVAGSIVPATFLKALEADMSWSCTL